MMTSENLTLRIERTFTVAPERVFSAWTDPDKLRHWFAPNDGLETEADVDLRVGGSYRFKLGSYIVLGVYKEIKPPERLVFTWQWDHEDAFEEMLVTVDIHEQAGGTRLILTHERLTNQDEFDNHGWAWNQNMVRLERFLKAE